MKKRTLWSSKNSVSQKWQKKKKSRVDVSSLSPRAGERNTFLEYDTPDKVKKIKLGQTHEFTPNRLQSTYTSLGNFNNQFTSSKRVQKDVRIQSSFGLKGTKVLARPPLYSNYNHTGTKDNEIPTKLLKYVDFIVSYNDYL